MKPPEARKLINFVRENKCLWDPGHKGYHSRELQRITWLELSQKMDSTPEAVKKKWKGLRDTFTKELKKSGGKNTNWEHFELLLFLRPLIIKNKHKKMQKDGQEVDDDENQFADIDESQYLEEEDNDANSSDTDSSSEAPSASSNQYSLKRKTSETTKSHGKKNFKSENDDDPLVESDIQFLMSLAPFLRDVPKERKLLVRSKLQQVVMNEIMSNPLETYMASEALKREYPSP